MKTFLPSVRFWLSEFLAPYSIAVSDRAQAESDQQIHHIGVGAQPRQEETAGHLPSDNESFFGCAYSVIFRTFLLV